MSSKKIYAKAAERLMHRRDLEVGRGATDAEIASAEQELNLPVHGCYREFLKQFGWGGAGSFELYGLGSDVPFHLDLVRVTRSEREEMRPSLTAHLLPLMNDGGGNLYCLDTRGAPEPKVVLWEHDHPADQAIEAEADDFARWLSSLLDDLDEH